MTGNNISGIAKTILQARANLKTESSSKNQEQDFTANFMELMGQNNLSAGANTSVEKVQPQVKMDADSYQVYSSTANSVSVKANTTTAQVKTEVAENLKEFEEDVKSVLKDEFGVTEEEIESAMETLGLSYVELANPQNLTALVQELTGQDIGTLFLSEDFQNVMEQVSVLTEQLCEELGITKEDLTVLCEELSHLTADMPQAETENSVGELDAEKLSEDVTVQQNTDEKAADTQIQSVAAPIKQDAAEEDSNTVDTDDLENQTKEAVAQIQKDDRKESLNDGKEQSFSEHPQNAKSEILNTDTSVVGQQTVRNEEFILPQETLQQPYTNQINTVDLIDQIVANARVTVSTETTSMEMQLNPENLGKIYLNISEKEGSIRAQIAAQNQAVKEALETQIVELRQSLNQQGIKVDAIEVTVATHEFEQNLEGNAKQEEQMQQQMEETEKQTKARRNLNLNDLDGLSGLMSEEETLVAKIMRDNGNQVDLTA